MNDRLEIYTLGGLTIKRNGMPVTNFTVRKVEALLIYLAYTASPQRREALAEMLWNDRSQDQSLHNLRTVLSELRRRMADFVIADRRTVALNLASIVWMDATELDAALTAASSEWTQISPISPVAARHLEQTLNLYHGEFLEGFHVRECRGFEDWMRLERERLRETVIVAMHYLVDADLNAGAYAAGIAQATRLLKIDPLREEAHRQMMLLLARTGQRRGALKQFETCRDLVLHELGIEPSVETMALLKAIQSGQLSEGPGRHIDPVVVTSSVNLPAQATPFIGRQVELALIAERLSDPDCRLLTLIGPGGIGKSRLALHVATDKVNGFVHGVQWISLVSVVTHDKIASSIADVLKIYFDGKEDANAQVIRYLGEKHMLLVMDNFEHLLEGVNLLTDILANAPRIKILVTSRERLNVQEEWTLPIEGLDFPEQQKHIKHTEAESYSAIRLFVQYARRIYARFSLQDEVDAVIDICRAVEGMPLGIELAATWLRVIPCGQIATQIRQDLDFLATPLRNIPERHRRMRVVFDHSWRLLTETEQRVLAKLSIFRGGFDLEAAEQVSGATLSILAGLADRSFVRMNNSKRYDMHELVRQYASIQLAASGQAWDTARSHLGYFMRLAEQSDAENRGPHLLNWVDCLVTDLDNIRAALEWSVSGGEAEAGLRLAIALGWFWTHHTSRIEGRTWIEKLLNEANPADVALRANSLRLIGALTTDLGDSELGKSILETALTLARQSGNTLTMARTLFSLGVATNSLNDLMPAVPHFEEALAIFRTIPDSHGSALSLFFLGTVCRRLGDLAQAAAHIQEALVVAREAQSKDTLGWALGGLGDVSWDQHRDPRYVVALYKESLAYLREVRSVHGVGVTLDRLGAVAQAQGDYAGAWTYYAEGLASNQEKGYKFGLAWTLALVAGLELALGRVELSARLLGAVHDYRGSFRTRSPFGELAQYEKDVAAARTQLGDPAFEAAWSAGRAMTVEQATAYALQEVSLQGEIGR